MRYFPRMLSCAALAAVACSLPVQAATPPAPWIATAEGENLYFQSIGCVQSATQVLQRMGFARVTPQGEQVLAAWQNGRKYGYKAAVKCFPQYHLVSVTVVAERSGGLDKAHAIVAALRQYAVPAPAPIGALANHAGATGFPDCSDGPTMLHCLNSIPPASLDLAAEYLRKR